MALVWRTRQRSTATSIPNNISSGSGTDLPPIPIASNASYCRSLESRPELKRMRLSLLLLPSAVVVANGFTSSSSSSLHHGQQQYQFLQRHRRGGASILPFFRGGGGLHHDDLTPASPISSSTSSTCLASTTSSSSTDTAAEVMSPANWELLSSRGKSALLRLIEHDLDHQHQTHVYGNWPEVGVEDEEKRMLAEQVSEIFDFRLVGSDTRIGILTCKHTLLLFTTQSMVLHTRTYQRTINIWCT